MPDWDRVIQQLRETGYSGFEFDSGETAVPGLSGEWVAGEIAREGSLKKEASTAYDTDPRRSTGW